jgi:site-specific recombinase XerD
MAGLLTARRAYAINLHRADVDVFSLQKLMVHADLQLLRRYLAQTTEDITQAHRVGSPMDKNRILIKPAIHLLEMVK